MIIGSHVSMSSPDYVLGSVKEMLSYEANACMIYTGPPQNSRRVPTLKLKIAEAKKLMIDNDCKVEHLVVHAPYLINLANTFNQATYENSVELLKSEIQRCDAIGACNLVLHPGSHVNAGSEIGIQSIIKGLKEALNDPHNCTVCIETMAGKGSECGKTFEEVAQIIQACPKLNLGVCLDTCHIHDGGYDVSDFDAILMEFDKIIGLDYLKVIHLNDSKNERGSHKDRHENLGHGLIGFDALCRIAHHPQLENIPIILETPYINDRPPYKEEIEMLRNKKFVNIK